MGISLTKGPSVKTLKNYIKLSYKYLNNEYGKNQEINNDYVHISSFSKLPSEISEVSYVY